MISPRPNHMMILSNTSSDSDCSDQSGCARDDMIGLKLNFVEVLFYIAKQTGISDAQYLKYYNGDRIKDGVLLLPLLLRLLLVLPLLLWLLLLLVVLVTRSRTRLVQSGPRLGG